MDKAIFETAHLAALNDQQRAAVEAVNGPVLLLAVRAAAKPPCSSPGWAI